MKHCNRGRAHWFRRPVKLACGLGLIALGALGAYANLMALVGFAAFMMLMLMLGSRIDYLILRRRWRSVPQFNEDMTVKVSEQSIESSSHRTSGRADLSAYLRVVEFSDGLLLYSAPWSYFWLPDSRITSGNPQAARTILKAVVADYRVA